MPLQIKTNERVAIVGMTGSGKSTFAQYLTRGVKRLVLCDPKAEMRKEEWRFDAEWSDKAYKHLKADKENKGRYRLLAPINQSWEKYFEQFYDIGNLVVYIDEMYAVTGFQRDITRYPYLSALYTRGRTKGIGVWAATQRPRWVPIFALSESEWLIVFRLQYRPDRELLATIGGDRLMLIPRAEYGFWIKYYRWPDAEQSSGLRLTDTQQPVAAQG